MFKRNRRFMVFLASTCLLVTFGSLALYYKADSAKKHKEALSSPNETLNKVNPKTSSLLEEKLLSEKAILESRIKTAQVLVDLANKTLEKRKEALEIEKTLFSNKSRLLENDNVSNAEFLRSKLAVARAEVSVLEAAKNANKAKDHWDQLKYSMADNNYKLKKVKSEKR